MKLKKAFKFIFCFLLLFCNIFYAANYAAAQPQNNLGAQTLAQSPNCYVPVIMYHMLSNEIFKNDLSITPEAFENDLKYLSENGYNTVFISELIDFVYNNKPLPENPVVLTFDDGYYNNYVYAMPLLKKYNMKMVLSVIGESTDTWSGADYTDVKYGHINWEQLNEMLASGHVEIANHTYKLHKNTGTRNGASQISGETLETYKEALSNDLLPLQMQIKGKCGQMPECFTYPYGRISESSNGIMKQLGFKATLSCASGINKLEYGNHDCLFSMKRNNREANKPVSVILKGLAEKVNKAAE